mmetsp:Transcript_50713/g.110061  ORF Transcript_50713/g.110061 Transcript_50713/m.110061 type:complete len:102 (-) Transcript_50713:130-435(-)
MVLYSDLRSIWVCGTAPLQESRADGKLPWARRTTEAFTSLSRADFIDACLKLLVWMCPEAVLLSEAARNIMLPPMRIAMLVAMKTDRHQNLWHEDLEMLTS